jgi:hypothetical protein
MKRRGRPDETPEGTPLDTESEDEDGTTLGDLLVSKLLGDERDRTTRDVHARVVLQLYDVGLLLSGASDRLAGSAASTRIDEALTILDDCVRELEAMALSHEIAADRPAPD